MSRSTKHAASRSLVLVVQDGRMVNRARMGQAGVRVEAGAKLQSLMATQLQVDRGTVNRPSRHRDRGPEGNRDPRPGTRLQILPILLVRPSRPVRRSRRPAGRPSIQGAGFARQPLDKIRSELARSRTQMHCRTETPHRSERPDSPPRRARGRARRQRVRA